MLIDGDGSTVTLRDEKQTASRDFAKKIKNQESNEPNTVHV